MTRNNCVTNFKLLNTMIISLKFIFLGIILGFHSRDETAMSVYKTMAKFRSSFA